MNTPTDTSAFFIFPGGRDGDEAAKQRAARRRSESEWRVIVELCEQSGVSATSFCRDAGISLNTPRYWRSKLRRSSSARSAGVAQFIEMRPVPLARRSDV